jgi:hypothetical protein
MEAIVGFAVGYVLGVRAGREGLEELRTAWSSIRRSEEFQALLSGAAGLAGGVLRQVVAQRRGAIADRVAAALAGQAKEVLERRLRAV